MFPVRNSNQLVYKWRKGTKVSKDCQAFISVEICVPLAFEMWNVMNCSMMNVVTFVFWNMECGGLLNVIFWKVNRRFASFYHLIRGSNSNFFGNIIFSIDRESRRL